MTLHFQKRSPGARRDPNWLPTGNGLFYLLFRFYHPDPRVYAVLDQKKDVQCQPGDQGVGEREPCWILPKINRVRLDSDGDGVDDVEDNCPLLSNANQADSDGNGAGDTCDTPGLIPPFESCLGPFANHEAADAMCATGVCENNVCHGYIHGD